MEEFRVNQYITLKLEDNKTNIYVNEELFDQCKYLLLEIPIKTYEALEEIESVDEAAERLGKTLEGAGKKDIEIPPDVEFWGHCSNLQVWVENKYDTHLLHRSLAFPLLKKLTELGDLLAKIKLKEEIVKRFESGFFPVVEYLINEGYLRFFNNEEILDIFLESDKEKEAINGIKFLTKKNFALKANLDFFDDREPSFFFYELYFSITIQNKHIVGIDLTSCQLKKIPRPIFELSFLKKLYLDYNEITDIHEDIGKLTSLVDLSLKRNNLSYTPKSIIKLKFLKNLGFESNKLKEIPDIFNDSCSLEFIYLGYNDIDRIPETIGKCKNLKQLHLEYNNLRSIPNSISQLKSMEWLNLEGNDINKKKYNILE